MSEHVERPVVLPAAPDRSEANAELPGPPPVRWGVVGAAAEVAQRRVLPALSASPKASLEAVADHSHGPGREYDAFGAARAHPTYEELLADEGVEAVYLSVPTAVHGYWVEEASRAGKHVVCQPPLASSPSDAAAMTSTCRDAGVLLMEAYVAPFHPRATAVLDLLGQGRLGELRFAHAACALPGDPDDGSLLGLGPPCVAPLLAAAGCPPVGVAASAVTDSDGGDTSFSAWLDFGTGFTATVACSIETAQHQSLEVHGTEGSIFVERAFTPGADDTGFDLARNGTLERLEIPGADPYRGMVDHVAAVLRDSADLRHPPARSVEVLVLVDRLRDAAKLRNARVGR